MNKNKKIGQKSERKRLCYTAWGFSWATYLEEAYDDFKYLDELPGKKILLKGNHDYWWTTITNMKII